MKSTKSSFIEDVIRGDVSKIPQIQQYLPKSKLTVFLSSTFTDTHIERNILNEVVLPALQNQYRQNDIQITFSDMRFGVKDENTVDHLTWIICSKEIQRCYEESDGLFFLSLQSEKYGYMPLPKFIPQSILSPLLSDKTKGHEQEAVELISEWYALNTNNTPPSFDLQQLTKDKETAYYSHVLPYLRDSSLLDNIPFDSSYPQLKLNHSVTEWETIYALLLDAPRCYWIHRQFNESSCVSVDPVEGTKKNKFPLLSDTQDNQKTKDKFTHLKSEIMKKQFPSQAIHEFPYAIEPEDYLQGSSNAQCAIYLNEWKSTLETLFHAELQKIIQKRQSWKSSTENGFSLDGDYLDEFLYHNRLAYQKSNSYLGRTELILQCKELLEPTKKKSNKLFPSIFGE
jgi:hypothetical protein